MESSETEVITISDDDVDEQISFIGCGVYSTVHKSIRDGKEVAIKTYKLDKNSDRVRESFETELRILGQIKNDSRDDVLPLLLGVETGIPYKIVCELLGPDLLTVQKRALNMIPSSERPKEKYPVFKTSDIKVMTKCIAEAMCYLNNKGYTHMDLKLENCLLASRNQIMNCRQAFDDIWEIDLPSVKLKVIDLNSCELLDSSDLGDGLDSDRQTAHYRAPEVIFRYGFDSTVDVWSLGCLIMELYTGALLFSAKEGPELVRQHCDCLREVPTVFTRWLEDTGKEPLDEPSPEFRSNMRSLIRYLRRSDPMRKSLYKCLVTMLRYDPQERSTFEEIIADPFLAGVH